VAPARRLLKVALGLGVSAGLLAYLFHDADLADIARRLLATRWEYLSLSIALFLGSLWVRALRWRYLFPPGARPAGLLRAVLIGYTGNNLLPLRAGEVLRAWVAARRGQRFWTAVATLVVERVLDGLAVGLMLAVLFLTLPVPRHVEWAALLFLSVDLAMLAALGALALWPGPVRRAVLAATSRWPAAARRAGRLLDVVDEGLAGVRARSHLPPILATSAAIWLVLAASVWAAFRAASLDLPLAAAWTVLAFVGLGISLPSSPGFAGVFQAAVVLALALFAVPQPEALAFSILLHGAHLVPLTLAGLGLLALEPVSLAEASRGAGPPGPG
jgi:hypothetical protein